MWISMWKEFFPSRTPRGWVEWNFQVLPSSDVFLMSANPNACPNLWLVGVADGDTLTVLYEGKKATCSSTCKTKPEEVFSTDY